MLRKFTVTGFKNFNESFEFDLQNSNAYAFNKSSIRNGIVNNAIIYGHNGVGKSNLGFAIFDIVAHLTDNDSDISEYDIYLNAFNNSGFATFRYEFLFEDDVVIYEYDKSDIRTILYERIEVNGIEYANINRRISDVARVTFDGTENLKTELTNKNLSLLKYIKNNSVLDETRANLALLKFYHFVDGMLFFRVLDTRIYLGLEKGNRVIQEDIIERGNVADLEHFLNKGGIECKLKVIDESGKDIIAFEFGERCIAFYEIASTGTKALTLFYYWLQRLRERDRVSFLFIDEFDAFYHYDLSEAIVEELKKTGIQFILTTHNTSILSNDLLRPDCYFLMNKYVIKSLAKSTGKELREAHNIEKMYKAGTFNE